MTEEITNSTNELQLMEALASTPETTQADLAAQVGVAVGTVNWYLKRWSKKGYVKISRINRWRWHYLLTTEGMARKAKLASQYVEASLGLYRRTRAEALRLLGEVRNRGYQQVVIDGEGEIAEICRLTCLEMQIQRRVGRDGKTPELRVDGVQVRLFWPQGSNGESSVENNA
ncbi:MAG: winged helix-turn-helix domain-containing protein [Chloroflexota bacterium]|nr:winged helix-turn-helix domain-containing protein [Chloroflexota bacterium]